MGLQIEDRLAVHETNAAVEVVERDDVVADRRQPLIGTRLSQRGLRREQERSIADDTSLGRAGRAGVDVQSDQISDVPPPRDDRGSQRAAQRAVRVRARDRPGRERRLGVADPVMVGARSDEGQQLSAVGQRQRRSLDQVAQVPGDVLGRIGGEPVLEVGQGRRRRMKRRLHGANLLRGLLNAASGPAKAGQRGGRHDQAEHDADDENHEPFGIPAGARATPALFARCHWARRTRRSSRRATPSGDHTCRAACRRT